MRNGGSKVSSLDLIDASRVIISLVMLGYTSWIDIKTREIYDLVWVVFGSLGLVIIAYEIWMGALSITSLVLPIVFSVAVSILLGYAGLFGFADVEAFIVLAILNPFPPRSLRPFLGITSAIYPLTLFSNSALSGASLALVLLTRNLLMVAKGKRLFEGLGNDSALRKLVMMSTGMRVKINDVRGPPFQYPLEIPSGDGGDGRELLLMPDIQDDEAAEEMFQRLRDAGVEEVWVSHTLPFLVFIAIGYVLTLIAGDPALFVLSRFLLS
jgi:hypothetical protein